MGNVPDAPACTVARVSPLQGGIARGLKQKYGADTLTACRGSYKWRVFYTIRYTLYIKGKWESRRMYWKLQERSRSDAVTRAKIMTMMAMYPRC